MDRTRQSRLDPRKPFVLDTHELGRRPGSMQEQQRTVPAPADLGIVDLIGVPVGDPIELDLRLESVMEGVLVTVLITGSVTGECGRCLEPLSQPLRVRFQEIYAYPESEIAEGDEDASLMQGDLLDLEPALRDAVVLALPLTPLCREDCEGLCAECGERLADLPDDHTHEVTDARWSALQDLLPPETDRAVRAARPEEN
ncbi:MAG: hypothetical protein JWL64_1965 [Frankiales bacterium]|nr:hypothetical protein [Frankiales bacterium]